MPTFPEDAKGLMKTAVRDNDPCIIFEDGNLGGIKGDVPDNKDNELLIPFGKGKYFLPTSSTFEVMGHLLQIWNTISIYLCKMPIEITMIICFVIFSNDMYNIVVEKYLETSKLTRDRKLLVKVFKSFFLLVYCTG